MAGKRQKPAHVAHYLRERREALGLSQDEFAARLAQRLDQPAMDNTQISRWERGTRAPRPSTLQAMADVLGCTVQELHQPLKRRDSIDALLDQAGADDAVRARAMAYVEGLLAKG